MMKKKQVFLMMLVVILMMHSTALAGSGSRVSTKKEQEIEMINLPISEIIYQESPIAIKPPKPPTSHPTIELPFPEALIVEEPLPDGIEDVATEEYIRLARKGVNDTRKKYGLKALPLRDDLMLIAKTHALEMAKRDKSFHSKFDVNEAITVGDYAMLKHAEGVGAAASIHNFNIGGGRNQIALGIAIFTRNEKNGRKTGYFCIVSSSKDYVPLIEVK